MCLCHTWTSQKLQSVCFRSQTLRNSINTPPHFSRLGDPSCKMLRLIDAMFNSSPELVGQTPVALLHRVCPPCDSALEINFSRQQCLFSGSSNGALFYCWSSSVEQLTAHHGPDHKILELTSKYGLSFFLSRCLFNPPNPILLPPPLLLVCLRFSPQPLQNISRCSLFYKLPTVRKGRYK